MSYGLPPIVKAAERLMGEIEIAVTRFPRAHKYALGDDLRRQVMAVARLAHKAWRDREHQDERIGELAEAIDDLKLTMQLGQQVKAFARQVEDGQGGGWYLQLDIRNFFNSIHRPTLYRMLKARMERHGLPMPVRRATHALLRRGPTAAGVHYRCTPAERECVPAHKRLENAAAGCGIAIGNLSSQFFANVYLDALDQFVKHELRAPRYLRYVDDFVLVHQSREQLLEWRRWIERFLADRLRLTLKSDWKLRQLGAGVDFLGYVVYPRFTVVRRRVIQHARDRLDRWERRHVRRRFVVATPEQLGELRSICASYRGHFSHANCWRLRRRFARRYPWLRDGLRKRSFDHRLAGRPVLIPRIGGIR